MTDPAPTVWPALTWRDAPAMLTFCTEVLGFVETARHTAEDDPCVVVHAELRWPEGGGVMGGTADRADSEFSQKPTGAAVLYVVTDDPQAVHDRCVAAGVDIVRPMTEQDYGSTELAIRDPEGNLWSFGTYRGAPLPS